MPILLLFILFSARVLASSPPEVFQRTHAVLDYFSVPKELDSQPGLDDLALKQSVLGIQRILPILDPQEQFGRFFVLKQDAYKLQGFQDRDAFQKIDFEISLSKSHLLNVSSFEDHIRFAQINSADQLLKGIRIALDPGHMGGSVWDRRTGKYIVDSSGNRISEGLITLQTALLLEQEFKQLGAEVLVTRRDLGPVTSIDYDQLSISEYARIELLESSLDSWFLRLVAAYPVGDSLYRAFKAHPNLKQIFSESKRTDYFTLRADLNARASLIQDFSPDITLILHFDTSNPPGNPNGLNPGKRDATKVYVAGGFLPEEFASREDRKYFTRHLLDQNAWDASLQLGRFLVHSIKDQLGVDFDLHGGDHAFRVEPGIFARNLALTRKLTGHAVSYLECLYYNDPVEFRALRRPDYTLMIHGVSYPYSRRLVQVVEAIRDGVIRFIKKF